MFEIIKETTSWSTDYPVPNMTYLLDKKSNIIAYENTKGDIIKLNNPIKLDKRYRKFIIVKNTRLSKLISKDNTDNNRVFKVKSKEKEYLVILDNNTNILSCNCTGYSFRGTCKHINAVENTL